MSAPSDLATSSKPVEPSGPSPDSLAAPNLTIFFQGLAAFVRNDQDLMKTTEVAVVLVAAHRARARLCRHYPVLVFHESDFAGATSPPVHLACLVPRDDGRSSRRPGSTTAVDALGVWPLEGYDLRIETAARKALKLEDSFIREVAHLELIAPVGRVHPGCFDERPDPDRLVDARVFLTAGSLGSSFLVPETWTFAPPDQDCPEGQEVKFSQELRYLFDNDDPSREVVNLRFTRFSDGHEQVLRLIPRERRKGVRIAISNLCPILFAADGGSTCIKGRDFLAYYELAQEQVSEVRIPQRRDVEPRVGSSACPPTSTFS